MKNEIQLLIEELKKECDLLEEEMNACIKRMDFEEAELLKNALFYTRNKLFRVQKLEKPIFRKIVRLEKKIKKLKEDYDKEEISDYIKKSIQQSLLLWEKELEYLKSLSSEEYIDSDEIIIYLEKIGNDDLDFFQIEFEEIDFRISFEKKEKDLEIRIFSKKDHPKNNKYEFRKLERMSFQIVEDSAFYKIDNFDKSKIQNVLVILGKIVFEIFHLHKEIGAATIKFTKT